MEGLAQSNYSHMRFCGLYLFIYSASYDLNLVHWSMDIAKPKRTTFWLKGVINVIG